MSALCPQKFEKTCYTNIVKLWGMKDFPMIRNGLLNFPQ